MRHFLLFLAFLFAVSIHADQLQFEGILPPGIDKAELTTEYYRIYKIIAPRMRPLATPVRIVFLSKPDAATQDYGLPEWGGGGALGQNLIIIPTAFKPFLEQGFAQITKHELVHCVINRAYPTVVLPRWFHEGLAMTLSGELSFEQNVVVSKAIFTNHIMPLSSIDSVNSFGKNRADLAYCISHLSVMFLIDQYGMDVVAELLAKAQRAGGFWNGLYSVLSITAGEFEQLDRAYITSKYRLIFFITDYSGLWVVTVVLFLVAFVVTMLRKKKKMQQMEQAEMIEDGIVVAALDKSETLGKSDLVERRDGENILPFRKRTPD